MSGLRARHHSMKPDQLLNFVFECAIRDRRSLADACGDPEDPCVVGAIKDAAAFVKLRDKLLPARTLTGMQQVLKEMMGEGSRSVTVAELKEMTKDQPKGVLQIVETDMPENEKELYTLVRHSGLPRGVELTTIPHPGFVGRVKTSGGVFFPSYSAASKAEGIVNFPPKHEATGSLNPRCEGMFTVPEIRGLALYVPTPDDRERLKDLTCEAP